MLIFLVQLLPLCFVNHIKADVQQKIGSQFPNSPIRDVALAIDGDEAAAARIANEESRRLLSEEKSLKDNLEAGFLRINLGKHKEPIDLQGQCLCVPASMRHDAPADAAIGLTRYSLFVYGGVRVQPRINVVQGTPPSLEGSKVNGRVLEGQKVYRVWGGGAGPHGSSWTTVNPGNVSNYRNAAGLPNQNTGRFVSEIVLRSTVGVVPRAALPCDGNRGGLPEIIIPGSEKKITLVRVSRVNPQL